MQQVATTATVGEGSSRRSREEMRENGRRAAGKGKPSGTRAISPNPRHAKSPLNMMWRLTAPCTVATLALDNGLVPKRHYLGETRARPREHLFISIIRLATDQGTCFPWRSSKLVMTQTQLSRPLSLTYLYRNFARYRTSVRSR